MPKDDPQTTHDEIAGERSDCRAMMITVDRAEQMTAKLRNDLIKMLRRYDNHLAVKHDDAIRAMKAAARKK